MGLLQRLTKQYKPALTNFEKALSINPKLMDVFTNVILLHTEKKEFKTALDKCDRQVKMIGDVPAVLAVIYNLKGGLYLSQNMPDKAESAFEKALQTNPDYLRSYYALARLYLSGNNPDKAIAQYESILAKNPQQTSANMMLGTIYDLKKRFDLSEKHYRAALDIQPDFAPAANNLAYLLSIQDKNIDEALRYAQKAKEQLAQEPSVMDTLGWIYYKKGLYDSAISEFEDSLEKLPDNPTVNYHLGMAYYQKGDKIRAKKQLQKAISLDTDFDGANEARSVLSKL
jgi:tetratricopeptide (TPR) repeat protein